MNPILQKLRALLAALILIITQTALAPISQTEGAAQTEASGLVARITQVDTSQFPTVTAYISVTDTKGEPIPVNPNQLIIRENGEVMKAEKIGGSDDLGALATMLVMDISGSMNHGGKLDSAKQAAVAYIDQARPSDMVGLVTFNTQIGYAEPLTKDRRELREAIDRLKAQDDTAMYDALGESIDLLEPVEGRKAIIVLTDGLDNRSKLSPQQVLQLIGPQGLSISVIGLGDPTQSTGAITSLDEGALSALADQAGGAYGYADNADSLRLLYEKYGRALQSEYIVTYTSPSTLRDGVNRGLSVSVEGSTAGSNSPEAVISYNPGGLVPEVAEPASWGVFLGLLIGLVFLLFLPAILRKISSARKEGAASKEGGSQNIKLKSEGQTSRPKIKIKT